MTEYAIHLRAEPDGLDLHGREPVYRLKLALKRLLRDYGLRCVTVREIRSRTRVSRSTPEILPPGRNAGERSQGGSTYDPSENSTRLNCSGTASKTDETD
ncbi:MAG: hypothetical protein ACREJC_17490 [Tepidisphaeraceae bacterium]